MQKIETFRATLVSVKEGGGITGERKLREYIGELYGGVNGYEGKPTQQQLDRMSMLNSQLERHSQEIRKLVFHGCDDGELVAAKGQSAADHGADGSGLEETVRARIQRKAPAEAGAFSRRDNYAGSSTISIRKPNGACHAISDEQKRPWFHGNLCEAPYR